MRTVIITEEPLHLRSNVEALATLAIARWLSVKLCQESLLQLLHGQLWWFIWRHLLILFGRIVRSSISSEGFLELLSKLLEEWVIRGVFLLIGFSWEARLLFHVRGVRVGVMDLLEYRELMHTGLKLVYEGMLINAALIKALQAVQLHNIVMS